MFLEKGSFGIFPAQMMRGLKANEQIILTWLWFHKNQEGVCWPSIKKLADEAGTSARTVIRCIKSLEEKGVIKKITRKDPNSCSNMSNLYEVLIYPHPSDRESLDLVTDCHHPSDRLAQKPNPMNQNQQNQKGGLNKSYKPFIEGDRAFRKDDGTWRVLNYAGEWKDYVGDVEKHLEWR